MRSKIVEQGTFVPRIEHPHVRELEKISEIVDDLDGVVDQVHADLTRHLSNPSKGRRAMRSEQVLRILILKQLKGFSYAELQFELSTSWAYQYFCRWDTNETVPDRRTLQRNIARIRTETIQMVHQAVIGYAVDNKVENGRKVRTDCTVEETNIHHPTDSSLLFDSIRVLARTMQKSKELSNVRFVDHTRRAKRRNKAIVDAKNSEQRRPLYQDLLHVAHTTVNHAQASIEALRSVRGTTSVRAIALAEQLRHFASLARKVIDQTERRVMQGQSVPASDKIVSIFEPHTDIIRKDRRETYYGHKLCLSTGKSGLVLDIQVLNANPSDNTLATNAIERVTSVLGNLPKQVSFDGGFASQHNLQALKGMGVEDVVFHKRRGLQICQMAKSSWVYKRLKRFRAGIEGNISFLKRCFGLRRCNWKGLDRFEAYTFASTVAHNLLLIARHQLT